MMDRAPTSAMTRPPRRPISIDKALARRMWLRAQRLDIAHPFGALDEASTPERARCRDHGGDRASGLRADRHDRRHRAVPSSSLVDAHSRLPAQRSPPRPERREIGLRILDARFVLRTDEGYPLFPAGDEASPRGRIELVRHGIPARDRQGDGPHPQGGPDLDPRHRRRRAGREGPRLGEPQALEEGAAEGVLRGSGGDRRAAGHAEDLRTDRTALRLGGATEAGEREAGAGLHAGARGAQPGHRQSRFDLPPVGGDQAGHRRTDRDGSAPAPAGAGPDRGRREGRALGDRARRWRRRATAHAPTGRRTPGWSTSCRPSIR